MTQRQLWITPEVERFLNLCSSTPLASDLYRAMRLVSSRQKGTDGFVRLSAPPFLSYAKGDDAVFWHGPTDGAFIKARIWDRAHRFSWPLTEN